MKIFILLLLFVCIPRVSFCATSEQCYLYITAMVRSSNFPLSEWNISADKINLIIDDDGDSVISAKLFYDTDGTGTVGWIEYNKDNNRLYNTSADLDKPVMLTFNNEFSKAWRYCLNGQSISQVSVKGRLYLYRLINGRYEKTNIFIVFGDYVRTTKVTAKYTQVEYQTKKGQIVSGWVQSDNLRKIDFITSW
ncbi:hypothetical protein [Cronobacter condimenti]|uniref:hypothetical protein n=1 Tax=Cronobacter condimenti TaxID=1163710 RepID=UPI000AD8935F|nr:hypothetical protein [Cronobacter condimenti]